MKKVATALALLLAVFASAAHAQPAPYPHNVVTLVTHSSPGGGSDVFLREMVKHLSKYIGATFIPNLAMMKRLIKLQGIGGCTGLIEGLLPGGGGSVAAFFAYDEARPWCAGWQVHLLTTTHRGPDHPRQWWRLFANLVQRVNDQMIRTRCTA